MKASPASLITSLVADARARAVAADPSALKAAFVGILADLAVAESHRGAWADGTDVIGGAYERLLTSEERRADGQFFTPFWAGQLMADWLLSEPTQLLVDPGCGSGALLIAAANCQKRGSTPLLGLDLDSTAVAMTRANALIRGIEGLEVRESDFLRDELSARPDAWIVNPPYSRHHAIPVDVKAAVHDDFEARLGLKLSRRAALHVLFLIRAVELAPDEARLAFITPSNWLDVNYGAKVKEFLLERTQIEAIVLLEQKRLFFDGVLTTAAITFIRKGAGGGKTKIVRLREKLPTPEQVLRTLDAKRSKKVKRTPLTREQKWSRPTLARIEGGRLGDIADVIRGIATGCNEFFVISEARRREWGIPLSQLRRCATSARAFEGDLLDEAKFDAMPDDQPRWVLACSDPDEENAETALGRYLRWGMEELKAHESYLASNRKPWYAPETRGDCTILFTYFNRERPRFIRNVADALPLNNFLIVEPKPGVDRDRLHGALTSEAVINSLAGDARVYGGGLWKLEPSELTEIRLPGFPEAKTRC